MANEEKVKFIVTIPKEDLVEFAFDESGADLSERDVAPERLARALKSVIVTGLEESIGGTPDVEVTPA